LGGRGDTDKGAENAQRRRKGEMQPPQREVGRRRSSWLLMIPGAGDRELCPGLEVGDQSEVFGQLRLQGAAKRLTDRPTRPAVP